MPEPDVIDHLAEIEPASRIDVLRRRRPDAREHAQRSFLALFEPADAGDVPLVDRYAIAAFTALLHDRAAGPSRSSAFYLELLADEADAEVVGAVQAVADAHRAPGPYGEYREPALAAESLAGETARIEHPALPTALAAALSHAHLLVLHPRDARAASLRALEDSGWSTDAIVTISQLVAFLTFQLRVVHGLRVLQSAGLNPEELAA